MLPTILVHILVFCGKHRRLALKCPYKGWGLETLVMPYFHPKHLVAIDANPIRRCLDSSATTSLFMSSTLLLLNQSILATFHVITCHQKEKIQVMKCRVPWNMSLVLRVSTSHFEFSYGPVTSLRVFMWLQKPSIGAHLFVPPLLFMKVRSSEFCWPQGVSSKFAPTTSSFQSSLLILLF